ncbi:methyltransferase domain-containing protein [Candidatus Woesearchaeota archaeon]|nr:methyltransferase domain-containing protein [Candidatus Woesearchaeota archaeon]
MRLLLSREGDAFLVEGAMHTRDGTIPAAVLSGAKPGESLRTNTGKEYFVLEPSFLDSYRRISRKAQIIPLKDLGSIIIQAGIGKDSFVIDAGAGSGALACMLAHIARRVVSYDIRPDFLEVARKNAERLSLANLTLKDGDIRSAIEEREADAMTIDIPDPWAALDTAFASLKVGGILVAYSPTVPQVMDFSTAVRKHPGFLFLRTIEIIEREWESEERKVRPLTQQIGHSGFLSFARKVRS